MQPEVEKFARTVLDKLLSLDKEGQEKYLSTEVMRVVMLEKEKGKGLFALTRAQELTHRQNGNHGLANRLSEVFISLGIVGSAIFDMNEMMAIMSGDFSFLDRYL